jgi:hypothetical protein
MICIVAIADDFYVAKIVLLFVFRKEKTKKTMKSTEFVSLNA